MKLKLESPNDTFVIEPQEAKAKPLQIGRLPECDLRIISDDISREHAELICRGNAWFVRDLESKFGTSINGIALKNTKPRRLTKGDLLSFGSYTFSVEFITPPRRMMGRRGAPQPQPQEEEIQPKKRDEHETKLHEAITGLDESPPTGYAPQAGADLDGGPTKQGRKGHFAEIDPNRREESEAQKILKSRRMKAQEMRQRQGIEEEELPEFLEDTPDEEIVEEPIEVPPVEEDLLNVAFKVDYVPPKNPDKSASQRKKKVDATEEEVGEETDEAEAPKASGRASAPSRNKVSARGKAAKDNEDAAPKKRSQRQAKAGDNKTSARRSARGAAGVSGRRRRGEDGEAATGRSGRRSAAEGRSQRGRRARPEPKQSGGAGKIIILLAIVLLGGGGYAAYHFGYLDSVLGKEAEKANAETNEGTASKSEDTNTENIETATKTEMTSENTENAGDDTKVPEEPKTEPSTTAGNDSLDDIEDIADIPAAPAPKEETPTPEKKIDPNSLNEIPE